MIIAKKLQEKGLKSILISNDQIVGKYILNEVKDNNGEVLVRAGFNVSEEQINKIINLGIQTLEFVNIDPINKGPISSRNIKD